MYALVICFHIAAALVLILVVLLQSGKAGDLAAAFGSTGSQTAFGARGAATVLTRATAVCAIIFMLTSLTLAIMFTRGSSETILDGVPLPEEQPVAEEPAAEEPSAEPPLEPAAGEGSGQGQ